MTASLAIRSICVFCGSSLGYKPVYAAAAAELGRMLAEKDIRLVYGGGHVGLMGTVADACLAAGGYVAGVMPQALIDREIGHTGISEMHIVKTMHERKKLMADLADAFIALPGGHGTLDEFCEILTWAQLGIHAKPSGILNTEGYYDPLLAMFSRAVDEGFLRPEHRDMVVVETDPAKLLLHIEQSPAPAISKWDIPRQEEAMP
jgi:uncharacterized protein (TIGR00730 family)